MSAMLPFPPPVKKDDIVRIDTCKYCSRELNEYPDAKLGDSFPSNAKTTLHRGSSVGDRHNILHWEGCYACFLNMPGWNRPEISTVSKEAMRTLLYDLGMKGITDSKHRKILYDFYERYNLK